MGNPCYTASILQYLVTINQPGTCKETSCNPTVLQNVQQKWFAHQGNISWGLPNKRHQKTMVDSTSKFHSFGSLHLKTMNQFNPASHGYLDTGFWVGFNMLKQPELVSSVERWWFDPVCKPGVCGDSAWSTGIREQKTPNRKMLAWDCRWFARVNLHLVEDLGWSFSMRRTWAAKSSHKNNPVQMSSLIFPCELDVMVLRQQLVLTLYLTVMAMHLHHWWILLRNIHPTKPSYLRSRQKETKKPCHSRWSRRPPQTGRQSLPHDQCPGVQSLTLTPIEFQETCSRVIQQETNKQRYLTVRWFSHWM